MRSPDCNWKHEDGSEMMFDSLVKENHIRLKKKDERFIKALIAGEPGRCEYVNLVSELICISSFRQPG
jgi:hypothetical protein